MGTIKFKRSSLFSVASVLEKKNCSVDTCGMFHKHFTCVLKPCLHIGENRAKLVRFQIAKIFYMTFKIHYLNANFAIVLRALQQ